jgi:hypothetical protein
MVCTRMAAAASCPVPILDFSLFSIYGTSLPPREA